MLRNLIFVALALASCTACSSCHLYGIHCPANLNQRFDEVGIGATAAGVNSYVSPGFNLNLHMKGPLSYVGGKNRVATKIIAIFPKHRTYVEVFAGGAQVLFHKAPSPVEVLNDLDSDVVTFFRVCQAHHEELIRYLRFSVVSRKWFEVFKAQNPDTLTDIQRAARFFYLQKNAFGGLILNRSYHYCLSHPPNFNPDKLPELIENTHKRLAKVQIECLPYEEILKRYDRKETLFYLDPPYWGRKLYKFNFAESDFVKLESLLRKLRGKFVLSLNDLPEVRKLFSAFNFRELDLHYTVQRAAGKRYRELLIANFPMKSHKAKP